MKSVPAALQADIDADCTTLCDLLWIRNADGDVIALTGLDRDFVYDDGDGELTYLPDPGYESEEVEAANDLSVDGTDGRILLPASLFSAADIRRGRWDDARFRVLRVNYEAPEHGHYEVLSGMLGDITLRDDALIVVQLDGNTRPLRQTMCWRDSLTCRAVFGSQESEAIEYCGKDVSALWVEFTVDTVDEDEPDRVFTDPALTGGDAEYVPGGVIWDTGANAGFFHGVDTFYAGGIVGLRTPARYAIAEGDTGRIRVDCTKDVEGPKGCRDHFGDEWVLHMRAEPTIPIGAAAQVPGARVSPGSGGAHTVPDSLEEA